LDHLSTSANLKKEKGGVEMMVMLKVDSNHQLGAKKIYQKSSLAILN
jgi:hypothetical protein